MAIVAYVAGTGSISADFQIVQTISFFDDNNPLNVGITASNPPAVVLFKESWLFPATLNGVDLQAALRDKILERGALFLRARTASADAATYVPVGALITIPGS